MYRNLKQTTIDLEFVEGEEVCKQWYDAIKQRLYLNKPLLYFMITQAGICYSTYKNSGVFTIKQLEGVYSNPLFPMIREEKLSVIKKKVTSLKKSTNKQIVYLCDSILKSISFINAELDLETSRSFMEACDKEIPLFVSGMYLLIVIVII